MTFSGHDDSTINIVLGLSLLLLLLLLYKDAARSPLPVYPARQLQMTWLVRESKRHVSPC